MNEGKSWARIIEAVTSFHGLCALVVLVVGTVAAAAVAGKMSPQMYFALVAFAAFVIVLNFFYFTRKSDLTFRIRITRLQSGTYIPFEGVNVDFFNDRERIKSSLTDDQGEVVFSYKVGHADELYLEFPAPNGERKKAALFSEGQCQFLKLIKTE